jgi:hypothetical protein
MSERDIEWIIANAINEQARGDPDALAPHIIAALEKAGYRITPATDDTALGFQPFDELAPPAGYLWRRPRLEIRNL